MRQMTKETKLIVSSMQSFLSGFPPYLASHFARSSFNQSIGHAFSDECAKTLVKAEWRPRKLMTHTG